MNKNNIQELLEQKLDIIIKNISKKTNKNYIEIFEYVDKNIFEIKTVKYKEKKDPVKIYLLELLKCNPTFIIVNKNLQELNKAFTELCIKNKLDTSNITEDYLQVIIVEYMESLR